MDETKVNASNILKDKAGNTVEYTYHNARCFKIKVPDKLGSAQAIYYDIKSLKECCKNINEKKYFIPLSILWHAVLDHS